MTDDAAKLLALMEAVPDTGTAPRALATAYRDNPHAPVSTIVESARRHTNRARQWSTVGEWSAVDGDGREARLKPRRNKGEALLASRTKDLVRELDPWVRQRRVELFERPEPPFHSLAEAATWIEQEAQTRPRPGSELEAVDDEVDRVLDRLLQVDPFVSYHLSGKDHWFDYWKADGTPGSVRVSHFQQPLYGVFRASNAIADSTMVPAATAAAWFLAGVVPGQRVRLSNGRTAATPGLTLASWHLRTLTPSDARGPRPAHTKRLVLDLDVRDLTARNLSLALQEARTHLAQRPPRLTSKQRRVVEVVESFGGAPTPKFSSAFWVRVTKALKTDNPVAVAKLFYRAVRTSPPATGALQRIATESKTATPKAAQVRPRKRKRPANPQKGPAGHK